MSPREEELIARQLLENQELIDDYLKEKRWAEVAAVVRYAHRDVLLDLAMTDPALFRTLREQITRFFLRGGAVISVEKLMDLAGSSRLKPPTPDDAMLQGQSSANNQA